MDNVYKKRNQSMDMATRLELLLDVVQQGSFAKAANLRNIDRSVISKQIKLLEDTLGVRLLNRSTRSLSLSDAGKEIIQQAEVIRDTLANTRRLADSFHSEPKGLLRLTSTSSFGHLYLQKAINIFMQKYPNTYIDLIIEDQRTDIIENRFDIAFRAGVLKDSNLIAKKLCTNRWAFIASRELIETYGNPETPEELAQLPSVGYANNQITINKCSLRPLGEDADQTIIKHTINGRYKVNEMGLLIHAVQANLGYALVPLASLHRNIKDLGLVQLLTQYQLVIDHDTLYAIYPHRNQTALVKLFIKTVQDLIGNPPVWDSFIE
jgi:DNA-binding transcriptional LysR family regulator